MILDLFSRRVIGWALAERMTNALTLSALRMALRQRQPEAGLIHHSDQGSQYTDSDYQQVLKNHGIQVSMNGVGTWYDNAPTESFFGTLKSERVYHQVYCTRDEGRADLFFTSKFSIISIVTTPHWAISAPKPMSSSTTNRLSCA